MMNHKLQNIFYGVGGLGLLCLVSCAEKDLYFPTSSDLYNSIDYIYAELATRADGDGDAGGDIDIPGDPDPGEEGDGIYDVSPEGHYDNLEATKLLDDEFKDGDALFFSQLVSGMLVPFQSKNASEYPPSLPPSFASRYPDGYENLYTYYYVGEENEKWYPTEWKSQEEGGMGGYNFFPTDVEHKMEWEDIQAWGYDNNGYALYALYNPVENILNLDFNVPTDQTDISALRGSNFIGAYHSSSSSGRVRFKLYHLMCYFKLTLYIPVFKDDDLDANKNKIRSGYPADALQDVQLLDVLTDFNINWYANRNSDDAPACSAIAGGVRKNINMFIPPLTKEFYGTEDGLPPVVTIKTSNFFNSDDKENYDPDETDECWKITVSALIPAGQKFAANDPNYPNWAWTDKNFIRINMRQNIGEVPKTYVFNGNTNPTLGGHFVSGDLSVEQGNIQHLSLYIPRHGAAAVLVGANVVDWTTAENRQWGLNIKDPENPDSGTGDDGDNSDQDNGDTD